MKAWVHGARLTLGLGVFGAAPMAFAASQTPARVDAAPFAEIAGQPLLLVLIAIAVLLVVMLIADTLAYEERD